jgi:hypothetical protein
MACALLAAGCGGSHHTSTESSTTTAAPPQFLTHGGFNSPSDKLEVTFKLALYERAGDPRGCYPAPERLVGLIRSWEHLRAGIAATDGSVRRPEVVYVIRQGTTCGNLRLALRTPAGVYILDSSEGPVQAPGLSGKQNTGGGIRRVGTPSLVSRTSRVSGANQTSRLTIECPSGTAPLGGGMVQSPTPGSGGEGFYPHSYERLGVQQGWHVSGTLIDPMPRSTTPRRITMQAVCASGFSTATPSPHETVFLLPGQTKSVTASCPAGQYLYAGGFQRTDFRGFGLPGGGGDYVTESRAVSPTTWKASASAFGAFGGELTSIAYCVSHPTGPLLTAVEGSTAVPRGGSSTATTPSCPAGRRLTSGGFSLHGSSDAFFVAGYFVRGPRWATTAYGYFGSAPRLTAYGYCLLP